MFHIGMWRERMRDALQASQEDRPFESPGDANDINDAELPGGIGTPLADASARADHLLTEILDLYGRIGERPINWFSAPSSTAAVLRNSFSHPRRHLCEYMQENGDAAGADSLLSDGLSLLDQIGASEFAKATLLSLRDDPRFQVTR